MSTWTDGWDSRDDYTIKFIFIKKGNFFKPIFYVKMSKVNGWEHDQSIEYKIRKRDYKACDAEKMFYIYKRMGKLLK